MHADLDPVVDDERHQPRVDFDHHLCDYWLDIEGYVDRARHTAHVGSSSHHGGFWVVTRAEEVKWVAQHPEIFSSGCFNAPEGHTNLNIPPSFLGKPELLEELDAPEHGKYRGLANVGALPRAGCRSSGRRSSSG